MLGIRTGPGSSLFSNIRFNTEILAAEPIDLTEARDSVETDRVLEQAYPSNARLREVESRYNGRFRRQMTAAIDAAKGTADRLRAADAARQVLEASRKAADQVQAQGFAMTPRERAAFRAVHATLTSGMNLDASIARRLNGLFSHVVKTLTEDDFLPGDPATAKARHEALTGASGIRRTADGRTDLLATFAALAQSHPEFRELLARTKAPKDVDTKVDSIDALVTKVGSSATNLMTGLSSSWRRQPADVRSQLDLLSTALTEVEGSRRLLATSKLLGRIEPANDAVVSRVKGAAEAGVERIRELRKKERGKATDGALAVAELVTSMGSAETAEASAEVLVNLANKSPRLNTLRELLSDVIGQTATNAGLMRRSSASRRAACAGMRSAIEIAHV